MDIDLPFEEYDLEEIEALEQEKGARRQLEFSKARDATGETLESELLATGNLTQGFQGTADLNGLPIAGGSTLAKLTKMSVFQQATNNFRKFVGLRSPRVYGSRNLREYPSL